MIEFRSKTDTRKAEAMAPAPHEKFRRFSADARRVGFAAATARFAAGIVNPVPRPYAKIEITPTFQDVTSAAVPALIMNKPATSVG
jgi:hypothetical protein